MVSRRRNPNQTLAYTASLPAATLLAYLNKVPGLQGNVNVTGNVGGPFLVTFSNGLNPALLSAVSGPGQVAYPLGDITLGSSATISVDRPQDTLSLATITDATHSNGTVVTKAGAGTLDYQGTNAYTGLTQLNQGTLLLDDNAGPALNGNLDHRRRRDRSLDRLQPGAGYGHRDQQRHARSQRTDGYDGAAQHGR